MRFMKDLWRKLGRKRSLILILKTAISWTRFWISIKNQGEFKEYPFIQNVSLSKFSFLTLFLNGFKERCVVSDALTVKSHGQVVVTSSEDRLLVREIMLFALKSLKRRHGFDSGDVLLHLSIKGIKAEEAVIKDVLTGMINSNILEEFYSSDRKETIYRLR